METVADKLEFINGLFSCTACFELIGSIALIWFGVFVVWNNDVDKTARKSKDPLFKKWLNLASIQLFAKFCITAVVIMIELMFQLDRCCHRRSMVLLEESKEEK